MPRRTHVLTSASALVAGLLLAVGVAACGGDSGSSSAESLERPPLTVGSGVTLPASSARTTTTSTTATTPADTSGGATPTDPGGAADPGTTETPTTPQDTGGGAPSTGTGTGAQTQPSNPGGAAPNFDEFCAENPGAC